MSCSLDLMNVALFPRQLLLEGFNIIYFYKHEGDVEVPLQNLNKLTS